MSDHTFDVYLDVKNKNDPSINFGILLIDKFFNLVKRAECKSIKKHFKHTALV